MARIRVQRDDVDAGAEIARLGEDAGGEAGAVASFVGIVRSDAARPIVAMTLEHYPGMTEAAIDAIASEAVLRFALRGCTVIHRVGRLRPGEQIVFVAVAASHRQAALQAVAFLMDWLKTRAPFWKMEDLAGGERRWVEARVEDDAAALGWEGGVR